MVDVVSREVRSRMMAGIRGKNTKPELILRSALHRLGFRFRIHDGKLPGKPDLVLPKYRAVIFAHGCFWHGHNCHLFKWPRSHATFWREKINRNKRNDHRSLKQLLKLSWRIGVIWECAIKGKTPDEVDQIVLRCARWIRSNRRQFELRESLTIRPRRP